MLASRRISRDAQLMCGRYVSPEQAAIERAFAVTMPLFERSYNVAPTQHVPVVRITPM
jgi:putative SOS response-associated peptidase YedK